MNLNIIIINIILGNRKFGLCKIIINLIILLQRKLLCIFILS